MKLVLILFSILIADVALARSLPTSLRLVLADLGSHINHLNLV
jgi:hypothetical protein